MADSDFARQVMDWNDAARAYKGPDTSGYRSVWIDLAVAFPAPSEGVFTADGIDLTGRASGVLVAWYRTTRGHWVGMVERIQLCRADGANAIYLERQLIPAAALTLRKP